MRRVLVIGDGQLGLMLAGAAARLGISLDRMSPEAGLLYRGTGREPEVLPPHWDADGYDVVTAEREHLPDNAWMQRLARHPGFGARAAIAELADRRSQKALLDRLGIPTAEWRVVHGEEDLQALLERFGAPVVVKAARGGYDGRGQWRFGVAGAVPPPPALYGQMIAERGVAFRRELSLVGARSADGSLAFYPLVENRHRAGMLRSTVAPARARPVAQQRAEAMLGRILRALDYVGVMAMELFEEDDVLLVNELAPRVHNSGHWSQDGAPVDQFELHLRALCGWPLPEAPEPATTAMLNLVGCSFDPRWLSLPGVRLHWYGKEVREGRKLGHLNLRARNEADLARQLDGLAPWLDADHALAAREAAQALREHAQPIRSGSPIAAARRKAGRAISLAR